MHSPSNPIQTRRGWVRPIVLVVGVIACVVSVLALSFNDRSTAFGNLLQKDVSPAPELTGGVAWLNTAGPVSLKKDLKGKVVVLDFWTLCCINCIHTLPDLAKLEKKYPNELVVIRVHSPKFENEKETKSIRNAILRYEIKHPVVNDANQKIWDAYGANSWPTLAVIDTEGNYVGSTSGEGNFELLDGVIARLIKEGKEKKTLNSTPIRFDLIRFREKADTPLFFPGKVLADGPSKRLFTADSTHHRIVVTDLAGKEIAIVGNGTPGYNNGTFAEVQFDDPQGMALDGDMLYVADRKNHSIRGIDLKSKTVTTVAGIGQQVQSTRVMADAQPADKTGLNSPWGMLRVGRELYIAMAGHHQLWKMNLDSKLISIFAGNGRENIKDGPTFAAEFAQPSGLATDGKFLYVADSETSSIRKLPLDGSGMVETIVGLGLFEFGDIDGVGNTVRLQHALGVAFYQGKVIVADTYNDKLKLLDPVTRKCETFLGGKDELHAPAGLSIVGDTLYVADTNANRIVTVDMKTKKLTPLTLEGVKPPPPQKEWQPPTPKEN